MFDLLRKKLSAFKEKLAPTTEAAKALPEPTAGTPPAETALSAKEADTAPTAENPSQPPTLQEKRAVTADLSIARKMQRAIMGQAELKESDLEEPLFELELSLLEADVEEETAKALCTGIKERLTGAQVQRGANVSEFVLENIRAVLQEQLQTPAIDFLERVKEGPRPYKILLLGPNGAGKTTTLAKLSHLLQKNNLSSLWAACDTFRAASIEQLAEHARALNTDLVKYDYGADPAAIAFDAVKAAKARKKAAVLVDSAGRQDTNKNLMEELKKLKRVFSPHLTLYIGEAFTGKALLEQARAFDDALGIDGFILTKLDTDPKGGTLLSLLHALKKPVLFLGTGQEYEDLEPFELEKLLERII